jgi:hypothetical protein
LKRGKHIKNEKVYNVEMRILAFDIGIKNLAYCLLDGMKVLRWELCNISGTCFEETSKNLIAILHELFPDVEYDVVLVENQPTKNPTMKSIQMLLYGYFQVQAYQMGGFDVKLVSASSKWKVSKCNKKGKIPYKEGKKLAVELCASYLDPQCPFTIVYNDCKKKDDLADAFLYCIHHNESLSN